jgi:hypothetical protein
MKLDYFLNEKNLFKATEQFFREELSITLKTITRETQSIENVLGRSFEIVKSVYTNYIDDNSFLDLEQILGSSKYKGLLVFSLDLIKTPKRKEVAELTRAFNRKSKGMPVCLLLRYNTENSVKISLALSERMDYKQEWREGERIGKVIILRDIDTQKPHAGHLRILEDLKGVAVSFSELHGKWLEVFDLNILNKNFFKEISNWYFWAIQNVKFPDDIEKDEEIRNSTNLIRLVTRIIFIWFIKEKGLVSEGLFDEEKLDNILKDFKKKGNYYNAILQNLFFGTLNQKIRERKFAEDSDFNSNRNEYGVKNLYRYASMFKNENEKEIRKLFEDIPFLNGGLFDCLDKENEDGKVKYVDGFSRNKNKQAKIPDFLFFGEQEVDLNKIYNTKGKIYKSKGLIKILNSYKFTITENTPQEEDVALDPELLGKVFENLLASYNPETKETARKQSGSFYTPREIVDYMVNESLTAYLREKVGEDWENNKQTISALNDIKILDPACGSGAFPMGILHKMVEILQKLDPKNEEWRKLQEEKATSEFRDAIKIVNQQERDNRLQEISDIFENNSSDYGRKLFLIENCIFGVDIQPIAVQISKLRFFLSLVIEQKQTEDRNDNYGIKPLPNLETKFVAANTLIGLEKENTLFRTPEIIAKESELKQVRHEYFTANNRKRKLDLQKKDGRLRKELAKILKAINFAEKSADNIANFDPYDQNVSSQWFDAEWMFGLMQKKDGLNGASDGFDIVIGNPPYVFARDSDFSEEFKEYVAKNYFSLLSDDTKKSKANQSGKINLFALFILKGLWISKNNGIISYIVPNNLLRTTIYDLVRKYLLDNSKIIELVDLGSGIFENVTASTIIFRIKNAKNIDNNLCRIITDIENLKNNIFSVTNIEQNVFLKNVSYTFSLFANEEVGVLIDKIANNKDFLGKFSLDIIEGIVAHKHLIFDEYIENSVPLIEGKTIKKYWLNPIKKFLLWDKHKIHRTRPDYLWNADKKIIIQRISGGSNPLTATLDTKKRRTFASVNNLLLKPEFADYYEFILAIINSKVINWYYANKFSNNSTLTVNISKTFLEQLPIPNISLEQQQPIIAIVNQILSAKKENPQADTSNLERQIDRLVYELYGLTEEERNVVEGKLLLQAQQ